MKKISKKRAAVSANRVGASRKGQPSAPEPDELRTHYDFDYSKSKPNRFASRIVGDAVAVVLDPDVASVFQSSEAVNTFLRSAIAAMPSVESPAKRRRAS